MAIIRQMFCQSHRTAANAATNHGAKGGNAAPIIIPATAALPSSATDSGCLRKCKHNNSMAPPQPQLRLATKHRFHNCQTAAKAALFAAISAINNGGFGFRAANFCTAAVSKGLHYPPPRKAQEFALRQAAGFSRAKAKLLATAISGRFSKKSSLCFHFRAISFAGCVLVLCCYVLRRHDIGAAALLFGKTKPSRRLDDGGIAVYVCRFAPKRWLFFAEARHSAAPSWRRQTINFKPQNAPR